ncbi:hypothetical protein PoB_006850500 [Plakobranchus ocellatus]|uniref:Uncharacterized protein n=1 Tax=Plakobranchus ocellatus TaxID=259542 RepID=A0AAV4DDH9_9GAST|nr:hypothetical protein PoB_006850500 [Plakobranchus ocellatus]
MSVQPSVKWGAFVLGMAVFAQQLQRYMTLGLPSRTILSHRDILWGQKVLDSLKIACTELYSCGCYIKANKFHNILAKLKLGRVRMMPFLPQLSSHFTTWKESSVVLHHMIKL